MTERKEKKSFLINFLKMLKIVNADDKLNIAFSRESEYCFCEKNMANVLARRVYKGYPGGCAISQLTSIRENSALSPPNN